MCINLDLRTGRVSASGSNPCPPERPLSALSRPPAVSRPGASNRANPALAEGLTSAFRRTNRVQPAPAIGPAGDAVWAKMFRIFRCSAVVVPLFFAVIGRCFETKNEANSETCQGMVARILNRMGGIGRVGGDTRTHLSDASAGCCKSRCICSKRVLRESRKAASGETRQPVFSLLIQAVQASLLEAWKRHWCGGQRSPTGTAVREV